MIPDTDKKVWTFVSSSVDAVRIMVRLPMMLVAPLFLSAQEMEAVQSAICGVNKSNISNLYHKEMERIAKMSGTTGVEAFVAYGRKFGLSDGSGETMWNIYDEIVVGRGKMAARSAEAVAYLQLWQDLVGNTIGAFLRGTLKCKKREEQNVFFEVLFFLYYFPLYILMAIGTLMLKCLPANAFFYKLTTFTQTLFAVVWNIPLGLIGLLFLPFFMCCKASPAVLPARAASRGYTTVPDNDLESGDGTYTTTLDKPNAEAKVGIRFGSNTSAQVMITNIRAESIASKSDLEIGDIVHSINGQTLSGRTPREAASALLSASGIVTIQATHADSSVVSEEATV
jgi:hypothetical protein